MKRRRLLVAITVLLCIGALIVWLLTPRRDPRLVGKWIVTSESRSNWSENWEFQANGTGFRNSRREASPDGHRVLAFNYGFRWWTDGDRLYIQWGATPRGWNRVRVIVHNLGRIARGEPEQFPVDEHAYVVEVDQTLRIEPPPTPMDLSDDALHLRRLDVSTQ